MKNSPKANTSFMTSSPCLIRDWISSIVGTFLNPPTSLVSGWTTLPPMTFTIAIPKSRIRSAIFVSSGYSLTSLMSFSMSKKSASERKNRCKAWEWMNCACSMTFLSITVSSLTFTPKAFSIDFIEVRLCTTGQIPQILCATTGMSL